MPQYASYNPSINPCPVTGEYGWYDTDEFPYPNLPPETNLLTVTAAQWAAHFNNPSGWAISDGALVAYAPPVPVPTLAQQAQALQANGLAITSTATLALNATYPADADTISFINSELNALQQNGTFADGTSAVEWPDTSGALHEFDIAQFKQFAAQIGLFVSGIRKCIIGATGATLPATQANID